MPCGTRGLIRHGQTSSYTNIRAAQITTHRQQVPTITGPHYVRVCVCVFRVLSLSGLTRELQQAGASLSCSADREVLIYSADATRNHM